MKCQSETTGRQLQQLSPVLMLDESQTKPKETQLRFDCQFLMDSYSPNPLTTHNQHIFSKELFKEKLEYEAALENKTPGHTKKFQ